ncbi:hypothetical protein POVWA2_017490 [Plasmodium ovale wallikeri]|uniref:Uncharacterized protein n=1 Tax=Plasmodium ovale wallikeri TaxID=864142 RepID=A0A1A8YQR4_PLAOA|nr:hypothetical protein POVWA1_017610 [Plasmodium ovale wallikeri]SBT33960.1 hypothetical protein POVWA2_017490 [Plasmodium ovale wallikeri]
MKGLPLPPLSTSCFNPIPRRNKCSPICGVRNWEDQQGDVGIHKNCRTDAQLRIALPNECTKESIVT